MNLKRLYTFIEVVDRRSFSEAANRLGLTQSAVSKQIKTLEQELGVHVLRRDQLSVELTEAGALAYQSGKKIVQEWQELVERAAAFRQHVTGVLRIGASTIPGTYLMPPALRAFRETYPHVDLTIAVDSSENMVKRLELGYVDVAVVGVDPHLDGFRSELLTEDALVLIAPPDTTDAVTPEGLKRLPLIGREAGSGTQRAVESALLSEYGIHAYELRYVAHVVDTVTLIAMVEAGVGFGFVSSYAAKRANVREVLRLQQKRGFYLALPRAWDNDSLQGAFERLMLAQFRHHADDE